MKRIISLLLVAVLAVCCLASCEDASALGFEAVAEMYKISNPTKRVAIATQQAGDIELSTEIVLTEAVIDGKKAAKMETHTVEFRSVDDGSGKEIVSKLKETTEVLGYLEGKGVCKIENGKVGSWDAEAASIIPESGAMALNLDAEKVTDIKIENLTLSFVVAKENIAAVFGEGLEIPASANVTIVTDGSRVNSVKVEYVVPANSETMAPESIVTIEVKYTYDLESVSF